MFHLQSDEALFERYRSHGDARAIARLVERTAPELLRVGFHLVRNVHDAEDIVQATFLAALESADSFQPGRRVVPWLIGILVHRAGALLRSRRERDTRRVNDTELERFVDVERAGPLAAAAAIELDDRLQAALAHLTSPYREPLHLSLLHGLNAAEIGEALGRPAGTVRTQLVRGLELLRASLAKTFAAHDAAQYDALTGVALATATAASFSSVRRSTDVVKAAVQRALGHSSASAGPLAVLPVVPWIAMKTSTPFIVAALVAVALVVRFTGALERSPSVAHDVARPALANAAPSVVPEIGALGAAASVDRVPIGSAPLPTSVASGAPALLVRVVDCNGRPVRDAVVVARPRTRDGVLGERFARGDGDGRARIDAPAPGRWIVRELRGGAKDVEVAAYGESEVVVELAKGVRVEGLVVDPTGLPVANASVWLPSGERDVESWHVVTTTRGDGRFALEHVAPRTLVGAVAAGFGRAPIECVQPIAPDASEPWSQELRIGFRSLGHALSGLVLDADGAACPGALVLVGHDSYSMEFSGEADFYTNLCVRTDAQGRFHVEAIPPAYDSIPLWARASGHAAKRVEVDVSAPGDTSVTVRLERGVRFRGTVRDSAGRPLEGAVVSAFQGALEPPAHVEYDGPQWARRSTATDPDGTFDLSDVHAGSVQLRASPPPKDSRAPSAMPMSDAVRVGEFVAGSEVQWDAVLGGAQTITGRVVDESGVALAGWRVWWVAAVGNEGSLTVVSDASGRFALAGCDGGGMYSLHVRHPTMSQPALIEADVRPNEAPLTLVVPRAGVPSCYVSGRLVDATGTELASARISMSRVEGGRVTNSASGAIGGTFRFGPVIAGTYELRASDSDGSGPSKLGSLTAGTITLAHGASVDLGTLAFEAPGSARLEVTDAAGKPLEYGSFPLTREDQLVAHFVEVQDGIGVSEPLQPGLYRVQQFGIGAVYASALVKVSAGEQARCVFALPEAVQRRFRLPKVSGPDTLVELSISKLGVGESGNAELVYHSTSYYSNIATAAEWTARLAPGKYRISVGLRGGATATCDVAVDGRDAADEIIDLPVPVGW